MTTRPISAEEESWLEYEVTSRQEQPKRLEEAAKFLSGVISISLTIFLKIGENDLKTIHATDTWTTSISVICWLLSLIFSFLVLFPSIYRYANISAQSIQVYHNQVVNRKLLMLRCSVILFILALLFAILSVYTKHPILNTPKNIQKPKSDSIHAAISAHKSKLKKITPLDSNTKASSNKKSLAN